MRRIIFVHSIRAHTKQLHIVRIEVSPSIAERSHSCQSGIRPNCEQSSKTSPIFNDPFLLHLLPTTEKCRRGSDPRGRSNGIVPALAQTRILRFAPMLFVGLLYSPSPPNASVCPYPPVFVFSADLTQSTAAVSSLPFLVLWTFKCNRFLEAKHQSIPTFTLSGSHAAATHRLSLQFFSMPFLLCFKALRGRADGGNSRAVALPHTKYNKHCERGRNASRY